MTASTIATIRPPKVKAKEPEPWGVPEDIFQLPTAAEMPLHVIPPLLLKRAQNLADSTGCRVEHAVMYGVAAASIAAGSRYRYENPDTEWYQPLSLYGAVVDISGGGKTIAHKGMLQGPLEPILTRQKIRHREALHQWAEDVKEAKTNKEPPPPKPEAPLLYGSDFTVEGAARYLRNNPQGGGGVRDEVSGFLRGLNQYKGGSGNDDEMLKEFYDGGGGESLRKSADSSNSCSHVHWTMFGGIQPGLLNEVLLTDGNVASGTAARFGFSCYHPVRPLIKKEGAVRDHAAAQEWAKFLCALRCKLYPHWEQMIGRDPAEVKFCLDAQAQKVFDDWQQPFARVVTETPEPLGPVWSKYRGLALRLAGLFHLMKAATVVPAALPGELEELPDQQDDQALKWYAVKVAQEIPAATMKDSLTFIEYLRLHSYRMYGAGDMEHGAVAARALARLFLTEPKLTSTTVRDLVQRQRSGLAKRETIQRGLAYLDARGWTRTSKHTPEGGGRPSYAVEINPAVHARGFGDLGTTETPTAATETTSGDPGAAL